MNKKIIVASLANIANKLDSNKLYSKANEITEIMLKIAQEEDSGQNTGLDDYRKNEFVKRDQQLTEFQSKINLYNARLHFINKHSDELLSTADISTSACVSSLVLLVLVRLLVLVLLVLV